MRLLTLNLRHGGGGRLGGLLARLVAHRPDVAVLTEFHHNAVGAVLRDGLAAAGLSHQATSSAPRRVNAILIAARQPLRVAPWRSLALDPVRLLPVRFAGFSLVGVHLPNLQAKVPHWEALLGLARRRGGERMIYLGDFNTGRVPQDVEGPHFRFSGAPYMEALEGRGWIDAWRRLHPTERQFSWYSHRQRGFRLDHALLSPPCAALLRRAAFDHSVREDGLSDHSALWVELAL